MDASGLQGKKFLSKIFFYKSLLKTENILPNIEPTQLNVCVRVCVCMCREKERQKDSERERER
jgi:hypothetical protein